MHRVTAYRGVRRAIFLLLLQAAIAMRYLPLLLTRKLSVRRFALFLRRLRYFLFSLRHNKIVAIGSTVRLNMYVPGFPSRAFFTACDKFREFELKLPCATALISVTSACRFSCRHCYQRFDRGRDVAIDRLVAAVRWLQEQGVAFFNIEGGEPFLAFDRLRRICSAIDNRSEIWINSTGDGMRLELLQELRQFPVTVIMFSLHSPRAADLNAFMGSEKAWATLERGVELCHTAGIAVACNSCLPKEALYNGDFERVMEIAKRLGASYLQLIKPKPAGAWLAAGCAPFDAADIDKARELVHAYNHHRRYRAFPAISAQVIEESPAMFGCTAGGTDRFYINAKGDVQPCEFLNISFGSIAREDFAAIYARMRELFTVPGDRLLCEAAAPLIAEHFAQAASRSLPLCVEDSRLIWQHWDRGKETELYRRIRGLS